MALKIPAQRIRLQCDVSQWSEVTNDSITGTPIQMAGNCALQFEMAFYYGTPFSDGNLLDFSETAQVVVALQDAIDPHNGITYWAVTVPNSAISTSFTTAKWNNGKLAYAVDTQQVVASVSTLINNSTVVNAGGTFWLAIYAVTTDVIAAQIPLAVFPVNVIDTGIPAAAVIPQFAGLAFLCSDGNNRTMSISPQGSVWGLYVNQDISNAPALGPVNILCSDANYRTLSITQSAGVWTATVDQAPAGAGFMSPPISFLCQDGNYRTLSIIQTGGVWTYSVSQ